MALLLTLLAAGAAWVFWRWTAYPGAPFRADLADLRQRLHHNRMALRKAAVNARGQNSVEVDEQAARQPFERQAAELEPEIEAAQFPGSGQEVNRLLPLVLHERVLFRVQEEPRVETSTAPADAPPAVEPALPPKPVEIPLQGITHDITRVRGEEELVFRWPNGEHEYYSLPLPFGSAEARTDFFNDLYTTAKRLPGRLQEDKLTIKSLQQRLAQVQRDADAAAAEARQLHSEAAAQLAARHAELLDERAQLHAEWRKRVGRAPRW
ncbi:hypothetical protein [Streptomyces sp. NBRC 109706]|uniref:hypothetical protein n=1 Tax=Streptomyces sp. NBRC 109706 TaxID=1550035 RepID=UPI0007833A0A|nr:hypothetical protein [Streptomyces sp. NBRC 109706]